MALVASVALGVGFLVWTGRLLERARGSRRATCCRSRSSSRPASPIYGVVSDVWIPRLFNTYAARYGVIGATFAIISALFGAMFVVVVMTRSGARSPRSWTGCAAASGRRRTPCAQGTC